MELSLQIQEIMRGSLTLEAKEIREIANYLVQPAVGVQGLKDLGDVTDDMLSEIPALSLSKIKINKIIRAFKSTVTAPGSTSGGSSVAPVITPTLPTVTAAVATSQSTGFSGYDPCQRNVANAQRDPSHFRYIIDFDSLPQEHTSAITEAKTKGVAAKQSDIQGVKLAISKKVRSAYKAHRKLFPGSNVHPGRKIYDSLADQMISKYGHSVKLIINGKEVGDGKASLKKQFEYCIQNQRLDDEDEDGPPVQSRPVRGKKNSPIGVLFDRHHPQVINRTAQEGLKLAMQSHAVLGWTEEDIKKDLINCFSLIRDDIATLTAKVNEEFNADQQAANAPDEDEDDPPSAKPGIATLKQDWPFLFHPFGLSDHYKYLTGGKDIDTPIKDFVEKRLPYFTNYLVTSSPSKVKKLALRVRVEANHDMESLDRVFLMSLIMIAYHFNEDVNHLIIPVEQTTSLNGLELTVLKEQETPCIIAMNHQLFEATKYYVCADKVPIVETHSAVEAFLCMVESCFAFDFEYPNLPLTMEFLERYVLGLGFIDTKIKKKGKQVVVITDKVLTFIKGFETFESELHQEMLKVPYVL